MIAIGCFSEMNCFADNGSINEHIVDKVNYKMIILDMILGDEGKNSTADLLLKDNEKKYIISNSDPRFEHIKPNTPEWNMANEYTSIDFLNSDEEDLENLIKK